MIKGVEHIRTELQLPAFRDVKNLGNGSIQLLHSVRVQGIDSGCAIRHCGRMNNEGAGIEPLVHGRVAQGAISNTVRMIALSIV